MIAVVEYDFKGATAAFDRSFSLSSSSALALGFSSIVRAWMGDDATAVDHAERAIRPSPFDSLLYLPYIGLAYAHIAAGRFAEAADAARNATQSNPRFTMPYVLHTAALANLGHDEEARMVADRLRELEPGVTVSTAIRSARYANPDKMAELRAALLRTGLPEQQRDALNLVFSREALPRRLLCHPERSADLRPAVAPLAEDSDDRPPRSRSPKSASDSST